MKRARRKIQIRQIVNDIRSCLTDHELMDKYGLSTKSLITVLERLVQMKAFSAEELQKRSAKYADSVEIADMRNFLRQAVPYAVPVLTYKPNEVLVTENGDFERSGILVDISENGIGVKGMRAETGEVKSLIVSPDKFDGLLMPFDFQAKCIWTDNKRLDGASGFEITEISPRNLSELIKLIELLELEHS